MYIYSFEKLEVWKFAKEFCIFIYEMTRCFPSDEKFGLVSQLRRASVSIASNIAEGSSRISKADQSHFYTITYSSTIEVLNQLMICESLGLITEVKLKDSRILIERITSHLNNLKKQLKHG